MISILQGQRDRYKGRLSAAEATQATLEAKLGVAQAKAQQMEKDNVTLYGKIRYLQSVVAGNNPGGGACKVISVPSPCGSPYSAAGAQEDANTTWGRLGLSERDNNESSDMESGMSLHRSQNLGTTNADIDDPEEKYKRMYEAKLNPFSQFNRTNQSGTIEDLSVSDHLIYTTLRQFTATPARRTAMVTYFGIMHLLVLLCFYWMTHHAAHIHGCDPEIDHLTHKTLMLQKLES